VGDKNLAIVGTPLERRPDMNMMQEFPWWKSRKEIKKFEETQQNWGFGLPPELTAKQLRKLFDYHKPREYVSYRILSHLLDHANCPVSVVREALEFSRDLRFGADSCLDAIALHRELSVEELDQLAERFLGEDIGDHAIGALVNKNFLNPDAKCVASLERLHAHFPIPRPRELQRYLQKNLKEAKALLAANKTKARRRKPKSKVASKKSVPRNRQK